MAVVVVSAAGLPGPPVSPSFTATGLTGATAPARWVGATTTGAPASGTFLLGDWVTTGDGHIWLCTTAGSPGTWTGLSAGFANPMATLGDMIYGTAGGAAARLAGNTSGTKEFLTSTGSAGTAQAQTWGTITASDVPTLNQNTTGTSANFTSGATLPGYLAPAVATLTFGSGTIAVNAALGNVFKVTLTSSSGTLGNPLSPVDGQAIRVRVIQGGSGTNTLAYGSAYDFGTAGSPTLSTAVSKVDIIGFEYVASISSWCFLGSGLGF